LPALELLLGLLTQEPKGLLPDPRTALALLTSALAAQARAGLITYSVTVDTSLVSGIQGSLDFQFDASDITSQTATATLTNFTGGTLVGSPTFNGDASGTLSPGPATINNTPANLINELIQDFNYGSSFSFDVTLSGAALQTPNGSPGSTFSLTLFDGRGASGNALLSIDANTPPALLINVNGDGSTSVIASSAVTATPSVSSVPEPASVLMLAMGGLALASYRWRQRRTTS
jgi:hypothetical protein